MIKRIAMVAMVVLMTATGLFADPVVSVAGGPITLVSYSTLQADGSLGTPWTISEVFNAVAPGVLQFVDDDGDSLGPGNPSGSLHSTGRWIQKSVFNNTGSTWTSFELELQEILGTPSGQGDGLSFADGDPISLTFFSDKFGAYTRQDVTRDYINFSLGSVAPGETVTFTFAVTDNSSQRLFYLNQTPNRVDRPVPEPGTLVLLGSGLLGLIGLRKKLSR